MSHRCICPQIIQAREAWILTCEWFTGEQRGLAHLGNLVWQTQTTPMLLVTLAKPEAEVSYKNLFQIAAPIHNISLNFIQRIFPGTLMPYIHIRQSGDALLYWFGSLEMIGNFLIESCRKWAHWAHDVQFPVQMFLDQSYLLPLWALWVICLLINRKPPVKQGKILLLYLWTDNEYIDTFVVLRTCIKRH